MIQKHSFSTSLLSFLKWVMIIVVGLSIFTIASCALLASSCSYLFNKSTKQVEENKTKIPDNLVFITESCVELSDKFGLRVKLSDVQKAEIWKKL